jgi:chromosome partitioning protein
MQPTIISIAFAKGGANKTTLSWALASLISQRHRVLAVDMDPQGSLSAVLTDARTPDSYGLLRDGSKTDLRGAPCYPAYAQNLKCVPASPLLAGIDAETASIFDRQYLLEPLKDLDFDFIVIDCPSSQGLLTIAPLCISNFVLSPVPCDPASFEQITSFQKTIELVRKRMNPGLTWLPLAVTMFDARYLLDREVLALMRDQYPVFQNTVRRTVKIKEQMSECRPTDHPDLLNLTNEILERITTHEHP